MLQLLLWFDSRLTSALASLFPHTQFFNLLFSFFSLQGLTVVIWLVLFSLFTIWEERYHKKFIVCFFVSFLVTFVIVNIVLKNIFKRERPSVAQNISHSMCPEDFSFPSGHAVGAFSGAVIFANFDKKRRYVYYSLAILISYSRIYLYCHYAFDVVAGALIGWGISVMVLRVMPVKEIRKRLRKF